MDHKFRRQNEIELSIIKIGDRFDGFDGGMGASVQSQFHVNYRSCYGRLAYLYPANFNCNEDYVVLYSDGHKLMLLTFK